MPWIVAWGRDGSRHVLVDSEDFDLYIGFRWSLMGRGRTWYAARRLVVDGERRTLYLHRAIAGVPWTEGVDVDHINHNTFDCRKENLRVVSHQRNVFNRSGAQANSRSGVRGVSRDGRTGRYRVRVQVNGRTIDGGSFATRDEAARQAAVLRAGAIRRMR